jgi:hypothetical protein
MMVQKSEVAIQEQEDKQKIMQIFLIFKEIFFLDVIRR